MKAADRRRLRFNGRVAHDSLRGQIADAKFVPGTPHRVIRPVTALFSGPEAGARDRELILGQGFTVLDRQGGMAFGFADHDGYVGWVEDRALAAGTAAPSHRVGTRHSIVKSRPDLKTGGAVMMPPHGALVAATGAARGAWRPIEIGQGETRLTAWMPAAHLVPLGDHGADPVAVAALYLGTPYLWAGNSSFGIDCSGLVQAACLACGIPCPGDSDQQQAELGQSLPEDAPLRRGDLLFWKGHVGWVADPQTLLHANAHQMAVTYEPLAGAIARIAAQGDGPVTARTRL